MLKKVRSFTVLLLAVTLCLFTLSPAALAQESKSTCGSSGSSYYQQLTQLLQQNIGSYSKNSSCQPAQSSQQNSNCNQKTNSSNCNQSSNSQQSSNCPSGTIWQQPQASQQNSSCQPQATAPTQTTKPSENTQTTTPSTPNNQTATSSQAAYAAEVVRLVNVERAANGLAALTMDSSLSAAAQIRAVEINSKFSHTRPNGKSCFTVLSEQGISYRAAGENIAIGQSSPAQVVKAWMDSPGHRANILGDYTKIGVGVTQAGGNFSGCAWAQFFTR